jgi:hypothetical protein
MSIPTLLAVFALVLAVIDQVRARGYDLTAWAVILISVALLWGVFVT